MRCTQRGLIFPAKSGVLTVLFFFLLNVWISGDGFGRTLEPELRSRAAVLYDYETGDLLYEKGADTVHPPASMTKLMTLHLVYRAIEAGQIEPNTVVRVGESGDFHNLPRRSSLMFLETGQEVTVRQLMQGLAVPSGNDAAVVLAELVSGSVEEFVAGMNREVNRLGLQDMHFVDPAGLSEENRVTAREFGRFCMYYIRAHPDALEDLHGIEEFTYPSEEDVTNGEPASLGPITQENYNVLIGRHPWVDGLKTGYIDESGYNIALTAAAANRRLVAVLMGGPGDGPREGAFTRAIDGMHLLSYGFFAFERIEPNPPAVGPIRVWKSESRHVAAVPDVPEALIVPAAIAGSLSWESDTEKMLTAPLSRDDQVGVVRLMNGEEMLAEYPLYPQEDVKAGGWLRRMVDSLLLILKKLR